MANLLKIGRLKAHTPTATEVSRLLAAALRNIEDANAETISDETRFDAAYKAIMQLALTAMMRTATARPPASRGIIRPCSSPCR